MLYAGGIRPLNAFYLGLYGGSELAGVLDSEPKAQHLFKSLGYREIDRSLALHRSLAGFRPSIDRQQMQIRRRCAMVAAEYRPARSCGTLARTAALIARGWSWCHGKTMRRWHRSCCGVLNR